MRFNISKTRRFMTPLISPLILAMACALWAGAASAEKADNSKPMNIESDSLRYDDLKQTSVFTGKVVMTKGTIVLRGGHLEVRQDAQGHQFGVVTAEPGKLAFFRQKREGADDFIEGEGETIEYDGRADTIRFVKNAQLRRLRGATLADEVSGGVIQYNNTTEVFTVDGGVVKSGTGTGPGRGRVRAVLTPKPLDAADGAAPPVAPKLRSTTTLGGERP